MKLDKVRFLAHLFRVFWLTCANTLCGSCINSAVPAGEVPQSLTQRCSVHTLRKDKFSQEVLLFHIKVCFPLAGFSLENPRVELYPTVELT